MAQPGTQRLLDLSLNKEFLFSKDGLWRLSQVFAGMMCIIVFKIEERALYGNIHPGSSSAVLDALSNQILFTSPQILFWFLMTTTFMISTFILILSHMLTQSSFPAISKTIYEFLYNSIASVLLLSALIAFSVPCFKIWKVHVCFVGTVGMSVIHIVATVSGAYHAFRKLQGR